MKRSAEERFQEIYERHSEAVRAYVRRRSAPDAVDDVLADTFLVCWRNVARVPDEPLPWLYAVARKTLANERRSATRRAAPAPAQRDGAVPPIEEDPILARAFALLTEHDREILRLIAWEQLSLREAATALGCSHVACRVRFHRARRRLAMHLETLENVSAAATPRPHPEGATQ